jgi:hypothetical protein
MGKKLTESEYYELKEYLQAVEEAESSGENGTHWSLMFWLGQHGWFCLTFWAARDKAYQLIEEYSNPPHDDAYYANNAQEYDDSNNG